MTDVTTNNQNNEYRLRRINNGTVVNHLTAGSALKALQILNLPQNHAEVVSIIMNVDSQKLGKKDILKLENVYLTPLQVSTIALFAPQATVNIIESEKVVEKFKVELPNELIGVLKCQNANCITKYERSLPCTAVVENKNPLKLTCKYCDTQIVS